jgi:multiple sugar transport system permease protein/putative aldouronate transport system permease protein
MEAKFAQLSAQDRIFTIFNYAWLTFVLLIVAYPLIFVVSASLSDPTAVILGRMWLWPVGFNWNGYEAVFEHKGIMNGFANTIFYTGVGTLINVVMTILAAYPLSRKDLAGRNVLMALFVFTMMFSGGMIPTYLLVKDLGMLDTRWALIIPGALSVWNMIITRTYFQTNIPQELLEAAQLDGCNDFRFVRSIVLPLSGPIIAVIALFYAVGHWNQYFQALLYLRDQRLVPLQLVLREILVQNDVDLSSYSGRDAEELLKLRELLKYSLIVVASLPVLTFYPFVQRFFVKGVMIGSLKG